MSWPTVGVVFEAVEQVVAFFATERHRFVLSVGVDGLFLTLGNRDDNEVVRRVIIGEEPLHAMNPTTTEQLTRREVRVRRSVGDTHFVLGVLMPEPASAP